MKWIYTGYLFLFCLKTPPAFAAQRAYAITEVRGGFVQQGENQPTQIIFEACVVEQISGTSVIGRTVLLGDSSSYQTVNADQRGCFRWSEVHPLRAHELRYVKFYRQVTVVDPKSVWRKLTRKGVIMQRFEVPILVDVLRRKIADARFKYVADTETETVKPFEFGQTL